MLPLPPNAGDETLETLTVRSELQSVALEADGVRTVVRVVLAATATQQGAPPSNSAPRTSSTTRG
jgi:hypothetical protein